MLAVEWDGGCQRRLATAVANGGWRRRLPAAAADGGCQRRLPTAATNGGYQRRLPTAAANGATAAADGATVAADGETPTCRSETARNATMALVEEWWGANDSSRTACRMSYGSLTVLDAAERVEDAINGLIARSPRRLLHVAQMRRSAHAIVSNIGEGLGRDRPGDRRRSFEIARGETEETIRHVNSNFREGRIDAASYWPLHNRLTVIVKMLNNLLP